LANCEVLSLVKLMVKVVKFS